MNKIKDTYNEVYAGYSAPDIGDLPQVDEDINNIFFWSHLKLMKSASKSIPKKIRRKLKPEEWAELKRNIENVAHHMRYALAYIDKMEDEKEI